MIESRTSGIRERSAGSIGNRREVREEREGDRDKDIIIHKGGSDEKILNDVGNFWDHSHGSTSRHGDKR
jgi:hypothetical protein